MRSKWKGLTIPINIYKLAFKNYYKEYKRSKSRKKIIYFIKRNLFIFRFLLNCKFYLYNGRKQFMIYVLSRHILYKFGEFFFTKKRSRYLSKRKLKKRKRKKGSKGGRKTSLIKTSNSKGKKSTTKINKKKR